MDDLFVARLLINHLRLGYFGVCNTPQHEGINRMDLTASNFRPPCWQADQACPNQCAEQVRDQIVRNHVRLHGPWAGWRLVGRDLVSPDGIRMSAERLKGLAWRQDSEIRLAHTRKRNEAAKAGHRGMVTVIRMPIRDWHLDRFGTRAG